MAISPPTHLLLGQLRREFIITPSGKVMIDKPGGNLLYAASGASLWQEEGEVIGLASRVGEDYPRDWLEDLQEQGFNTEGIKILPEVHDVRRFIAYDDLRTRHMDDPVAHFARREMSFPKALLGYKGNGEAIDSHTKLEPLSLRQADLPEDYQYASVAHLCYVDFLTHSLIPAALRQAGIGTVTMDPGLGYMNPAFWDVLPSILPGLTAFLPSEGDLRSLFKGKTEDLWEMIETVAEWGCELVVVKRGEQGQYLYDTAAKAKYDIPAYPSRMEDLTGAGDVFCGGFLMGYKRTYDPLQAVMYGNVAASIAVEGSGAFYTRDVLPGLQQARLESLGESVRKV
jgi:sugar/nucleoside kinase (ribokinase family)